MNEKKDNRDRIDLQKGNLALAGVQQADGNLLYRFLVDCFIVDLVGLHSYCNKSTVTICFSNNDGRGILPRCHCFDILHSRLGKGL